MKYVVELTVRAQRDLERLYEDIDALNSRAARKWYFGLCKQILSLETLPYRCAVILENKNLRHLLYGHGRNIYRVIYRIVGTKVKVLHIRHGARREFR